MRVTCWSTFIASLSVVCLTHSVSGSILLGTASGPGINDKEDVVEGIIAAYNIANGTSLIEDIGDPGAGTGSSPLKTDNSGFFPTSDFQFFSDSSGMTSILNASALHGTNTAYFTYSGPDTLLYYSAKAGNEIWVWQYMGPLDPIVTPNKKNISHVSFWTVPGGGGEVPEPASMIVWAVIGSSTLGMIAFRRRRRTGSDG